MRAYRHLRPSLLLSSVRCSSMSTTPTECLAIVCRSFGAPDVLQMESKPVPIPGQNELQIRVAAAGINPSDTYVRLGPEGPWAATPHLLPTLPFTPGKDGAGMVTAVGPGVTEHSVGDRVYTAGSLTGTCSEYAVCHSSQVFSLPSNISFSQGACLGVPAATAYHGLMARAQAVAGDSVFVHGASGAVGLAAVALARDLGCHVVGSAGTVAGEQAVSAAGAHSIVNHRADGYMQQAKASLPEGATGFDVVLEMAGHQNMVADIALCSLRGRVCVIGSKPAPISINPRLLMPLEVDIRGVFLAAISEQERAELHRGLYRALAKGALSPVVGIQLPLAELARAHVEVMAPSSGGAVGNIVLTVTGDADL